MSAVLGLRNRIEKLREIGTLQYTSNGTIVAIDCAHECVNYDERENKLSIATSGMGISGEYICYAGWCVLPGLSLGLQNAEQVIDAWIFFTEQLGVDPNEATNIIEQTSILRWLSGLNAFSIPFRVIGLATDLYALRSVGINITPKLNRLRRDIRSPLVAAKRGLKDLKQYKSIMGLLNFLEDIASETHLARLAKHIGYDNIVLRESPDLTVDGIEIEVKHPRKNTESAIHRAIDGGLKSARIAAIENLSFQERWLKKYNIDKILGEQAIYYALRSAINLAKSKRKCILFFGEKLEPTKFGYIGRLVILK